MPFSRLPSFFMPKESLSSDQTLNGALLSPEVGSRMQPCLDGDVQLQSFPVSVLSDVVRTIMAVDSHIETLRQTNESHMLVMNWIELMNLVNGAGQLILNDFSRRGDSLKEGNTNVKLISLEAASRVAGITAEIKSDLGSSDFMDSSVVSKAENIATETSKLEQMIEIVRDVQSCHTDSCREIDMEVDKLERTLRSEVDSFIDSIISDPVGRVRNDQVAFLLESYPDEIDAIRKTNSMRWLNDVLKWQVVDLNIQLQKRNELASLKQAADVKKMLIHGIVRNKLHQSASLKKLQSGHTTLDRVFENFHRIASSSLPTASSTPPTAAVKLIQSPAAKIEDHDLATTLSDIEALED